jgi:hypothetical protein
MNFQRNQTKRKGDEPVDPLSRGVFGSQISAEAFSNRQDFAKKDKRKTERRKGKGKGQQQTKKHTIN